MAFSYFSPPSEFVCKVRFAVGYRSQWHVTAHNDSRGVLNARSNFGLGIFAGFYQRKIYRCGSSLNGKFALHIVMNILFVALCNHKEPSPIEPNRPLHNYGIIFSYLPVNVEKIRGTNEKSSGGKYSMNTGSDHAKYDSPSPQHLRVISHALRQHFTHPSDACICASTPTVSRGEIPTGGIKPERQ